MPKHELEIGLNFKSDRKSVDSIKRELERGIKLPKDVKSLLDGSYIKTIETFDRSLSRIIGKLQKFSGLSQGRPLTSGEGYRVGRLQETLTQEMHGRSKVVQEMQQMSAARTVGGGSGIGQVASAAAGRLGLGRVASSIAGGASAASVVASAGVTAAIAYGFRALGGYGKWKEAAPAYAKLSGLGYNPSPSTMYGATQYGFGSGRTRQLMTGITTGMGRMDGGVMTQIMKASKAYGLDPQMLGQFPGMLTKMGGNNIQKQQAEIFAAAFNTKLERGRIGEYLEATASTMQQISQSAPGASASSISGMMSTLSRGGGVLTPGVAGGMASGLNELLRNPQGGLGMLMMGATSDVLKKGGYSGAMYEGMYRMSRESMFLPTPGELPGKFPITHMMGKQGPMTELSRAFHSGGGTMGLLGSFRKQLEGLGGGGAADILLSRAPGFKSANAAREFLSKVEFAEMMGDTKGLKGLSREYELNTEKNLIDINKTLAGKEGVLGALDELNKEIVGKSVGQATLDMRQTLLNLEKGFTPLFSVISKFTGPGIAPSGWDKMVDKIRNKTGLYPKKTGESFGGSVPSTVDEISGGGGFLGSGLVDVKNAWGTRKNIHTSDLGGIGWNVPSGTDLRYNIPSKVTGVGEGSVTVTGPYGFKVTTKNLPKIYAKKGQILGSNELFGVSGSVPPVTKAYDPNGQLMDPRLYSKWVEMVGEMFGKGAAPWQGKLISPQEMSSVR